MSILTIGSLFKELAAIKAQQLKECFSLYSSVINHLCIDRATSTYAQQIEKVGEYLLKETRDTKEPTRS